MWHFLTTHGFYDAVVSATVSTTIGVLIARGLAWRLTSRALKLLRERVQHEKQIADLLNTATPGGLTDVVKQLERDEPPKSPLTPP